MTGSRSSHRRPHYSVGCRRIMMPSWSTYQILTGVVVLSIQVRRSCETGSGRTSISCRSIGRRRRVCRSTNASPTRTARFGPASSMPGGSCATTRGPIAGRNTLGVDLTGVATSISKYSATSRGSRQCGSRWPRKPERPARSPASPWTCRRPQCGQRVGYQDAPAPARGGRVGASSSGMRRARRPALKSRCWAKLPAGG